MNEETALKPDQANEDDSKVEGTLLAFTPGQLSKLFSLKNVATLSRVCSRRFHRPSGEEQEGRGDTPAPDAKLGSEVIKDSGVLNRAWLSDQGSPNPSLIDHSDCRTGGRPGRTPRSATDDLDLVTQHETQPTSQEQPMPKVESLVKESAGFDVATIVERPDRSPALPPADDDAAEVVKQPETRTIWQEQLVAEVKGIYAGLVMVESKCIEVDHRQNPQTDPANKLNSDQWQALIALHRTLLHEHHDFFLASQHPSTANPASGRLAAKYAMPTRKWHDKIREWDTNQTSHTPIESQVGPQASLPVPAPDHPGVGSHLRLVRRLVRGLSIPPTLILLSLLSLVASAPIPHRMPKILAISLFTLSSLSTGMVLLQLELLRGSTDGPKHANTQLTRMWLRIAYSVSLGLLAVGSTLWFLRSRGSYKKRAFLTGFSACNLFCWAFVNPELRAASEQKGGDGLGWLDVVNLFGLIAIVVGILNAESSLFGELLSSSGDEQGDRSEVGRRRRDDEGSHGLRDGRRGDEEEGRSQQSDRRGVSEA